MIEPQSLDRGDLALPGSGISHRLYVHLPAAIIQSANISHSVMLPIIDPNMNEPTRSITVPILPTITSFS